MPLTHNVQFHKYETSTKANFHLSIARTNLKILIPLARAIAMYNTILKDLKNIAYQSFLNKLGKHLKDSEL